MTPQYSRRHLLIRAAQFSLFTALGGSLTAQAKPLPSRCLSFYNTHTAERIEVVYKRKGWYDPKALDVINHHLRDFRTGDIHPIDPHLLDYLHNVWLQAGKGVFEVISGYRSPVTNAMLRGTSNGVAKKSLHMRGRAIDIRLSGVELNTLRKIAVKQRRGGVGFYPQSDFVHLDTGRFRTW